MCEDGTYVRQVKGHVSLFDSSARRRLKELSQGELVVKYSWMQNLHFCFGLLNLR